MGLNFAEVELSYGTFSNSGGPIGRVTGDFRITDALGVQLDVGALSYNGGALGQIDGHFYLQPNSNIKYGLFLSLADVDGREATIGSAGIEMIAALSDRTQIEAKAEIGISSNVTTGIRRNTDFIAASASLSHEFSDTTTFYLETAATEFDEAHLRAVGYGVRLGVHYDLPGQPIRISAAVGYDKMSGRDSRPGEEMVQLGVSWRFGARGNGISQRGFRSSKPLDQLLRRGMF